MRAAANEREWEKRTNHQDTKDTKKRGEKREERGVIPARALMGDLDLLFFRSWLFPLLSSLFSSWCPWCLGGSTLFSYLRSSAFICG
jgi:hypothetical protein